MLKDKVVGVLLNADDRRDLAKLVKLERKERKDETVGMGTLLREFGMPGVRARLAELAEGQAAAV